MERGKIVNNMVYIDSIWFNDVGFALIQDEITREYRCYTKAINPFNEDEDKDIINTIKHGSKFPMEAAEVLFRFDLSKDWVGENPEHLI